MGVVGSSVSPVVVSGLTNGTAYSVMVRGGQCGRWGCGLGSGVGDAADGSGCADGGVDGGG